jgi:hypothetical protein
MKAFSSLKLVRSSSTGIECQPPRGDPKTVIVHGGRRYQYLDRVIYTCRLGLVQATPPELTCTETGEWDHEPQCIGELNASQLT